MSELIESLFQDFKELGYSEEYAEKLAYHTREIMEICDISKSQALNGVIAMAEKIKSEN